MARPKIRDRVLVGPLRTLRWGRVDEVPQAKRLDRGAPADHFPVAERPASTHAVKRDLRRVEAELRRRGLK